MNDWDKVVDDAIDSSLSQNLEDNLIGSEPLYIGITQMPSQFILGVIAERQNKIVFLGCKEFATKADMDTYMGFLRENYRVENVVFMEDDAYDERFVLAIALAIEAHKQKNPDFHKK